MIKTGKNGFGYFVVFTTFLLFILYELFSISFLRNADEIISIISIIYFLIKFIFARNVNYYSGPKKLFTILLIMIFIGLLGNIVFKINQLPYIDIFLDIFIFVKPYVIFIATFLFAKELDIYRIIKGLRIISIIMIVIMFLSCLLFLFDNSFFSGNSNQFIFLSGFGGTIANWTIVFLCIIFLFDNKSNFLFYILGCLVIYFSKSGLGILGLLILFFFSFVFEKIRFRWYFLILFVVLALIVSRDEITGYLLDISSPRGRFFYYAFITANNCFPIGSGFASYGSLIAANNYSNLYVEYGFSSIWGMTADHTSFLLDNYYPMIIGQFGYLGLLCFCFLVILFYFGFIKKICNKKLRLAAIEIFIYLLVMALGFNISGVGGCAMFFVLAIFSSKKVNYNNCSRNVEKVLENNSNY